MDLPDKVYFRIGEVAELLGVEPHVVRFWQQQFPTVRPERSAAGRFLYSRPAVERLIRIRKLLYEEGYTIPGARKALQATGAAAKVREAKAPVAAPEPLAPAEGGRREAELQAEVTRLQRDLRATEARLEAAQASEAQHRQRAAGPDARTRAGIAAALAEVDGLLAAIDGVEARLAAKARPE